MHYRPEIDGLRALAVLGVIIFHAKLAFFGHTFFPAGYLGVDIFFVISGYLITRIILQQMKEDRFSFKEFYLRRARRILPALLLIMIVTVPFSWFFLLPHQYIDYAQSILATLGFGSNILFWREAGYFAEPSHLKPLLHTWTLGVEEQYYLIFPLILFLAWRYFRPLIQPFLWLSVLASFALVLWAMENQLIASFYLLPTRVWEFFIGGLIAKRELDKGRLPFSPLNTSLSFVGIALILISMFCFDQQAIHPGFMTLLPVLGSGLFILCANKESSLGRLMTARWLVFIGLISYSFYLWHQPLFAFANAYSIDSLNQWQKTGLILAGLVLSGLSWKFIETPFRDKICIPHRPFLVITAGCMVLLSAVGLHGILTHGAPQRIEGLPPIAKNLTGYDKGYMVDGKNCYLSPCILGEAGASPNMVIKGNSHAGIFAKSLHDALLKKGKAARILANSDAHIGDNTFPDYYGGKERWNPLTAEHNKILYSADTEFIILSSRMTHAVTGTGFDNGEGGVETLPEWNTLSEEQSQIVIGLFRAGITDLLERGKKIVLVYPIPEAGWRVPDAIVKKLRQKDWEPLSTSYSLYKQRNAPIIRMLDSFGERDTLIRVYPERIFCDSYIADRCATHSDDTVFYFDSDHLSKKGVDLIVEEIMTKMQEKWGY